MNMTMIESGSKRYSIMVNVKQLLDKKNKLYYMLHQYLLDFIFEDVENKNKLGLVTIGKKYIEMRLSELLFHIFIWRPNIVFGVDITEDDLYDLTEINKGRFNSIMATIVEKFLDKTDNVAIIASIMASILENMCSISDNYGFIAGNTISLYDVLHLQKRSDVFNELVVNKIPVDMSHKEAETYLKIKGSELNKSIFKDKKNAIYPFIKSGSNINPTQLTQMFVAVGTRPSIDGTVMKTIIRDGYINGYSSVDEFYVEATTSLNALLLKLKAVPKSGYFSRKLYLLCLDTDIDHYIEDCGTPNYEEIFIENKQVLHILNGKYRIVSSDLSDKVKHVPIKDSDTFLIGKTIKYRTHIYCGLPDGKVCKTCFGVRSKQVTNTRIGGLPSIKFGNPVMQRAMSSKHKSTTNSKKIENEDIRKFFTIDNNELVLHPTIEKNKVELVIPVEEVNDLLNFDIEDDNIEIKTKLDYFIIRYKGVDFKIFNPGAYFDISDALLAEKKHFIERNHKLVIPLKGIPKETTLFEIVLLDDDVAKFFKDIDDRIDGNKTKLYENTKDFITDIIMLSIDAGASNVNITHIETIMYNLIKRPGNYTSRPNFNKFKPRQTFINASQSIMNKPNLSVVLAFERMKDAMADVSSYEHKKNEGVFDTFFGT